MLLLYIQVCMVFVSSFVQVFLLFAELGNLIVECAKCYGLHVLLTKLREKMENMNTMALFMLKKLT